MVETVVMEVMVETGVMAALVVMEVAEAPVAKEEVEAQGEQMEKAEVEALEEAEALENRAAKVAVAVAAVALALQDAQVLTRVVPQPLHCLSWLPFL
jgi:hypothetical protein